MNLAVWGCQYAALTARNRNHAVKRVMMKNVEVNKMVKDIGKVLVFAIGVNLPFWAYMWGWL